MKNGEFVRQGDVLMRKIAELPKSARLRPCRGGRIVVEWGEKTGHAHTLDPQAVEAYDVVSAAGAIIGQAFRVLEPTTIEHQEHGALVLDPGFYERWYQFEDDGESERQTRD